MEQSTTYMNMNKETKVTSDDKKQINRTLFHYEDDKTKHHVWCIVFKSRHSVIIIAKLILFSFSMKNNKLFFYH